MVHKWFIEFYCGSTSMHDAEHIRCSDKTTIKEMVNKIHGIILHGRRIKINEIPKVVKIPGERVEYSAWIFGHKKVISQIDAALAHDASKTKSCYHFETLFRYV